MAYQNQGNKRGGRNNFNRSGGRRGGGGFGGGRDRGKPSMHSAVCDECGNQCQVPFKPTGDRPVLCSQCFEDSKGGSFGGKRDRVGRRGGNFDRPRFNDRQMYHAVCDACDNECEVPFKPMGNKPVLCSDCFEKEKFSEKPNSKKENIDTISSAQFEELNKKLDTIIRMLAPVISQTSKEEGKTLAKKADLSAKVEMKGKGEKVGVKGKGENIGVKGKGEKTEMKGKDKKIKKEKKVDKKGKGDKKESAKKKVVTRKKAPKKTTDSKKLTTKKKAVKKSVTKKK